MNVRILSSIIVIIFAGLILYCIWKHHHALNLQGIRQWIFNNRSLLVALLLVNMLILRGWPHRDSFRSLALFITAPKAFIDKSMDDAFQQAMNDKDNPDFRKRIESDPAYKTAQIERDREQFTKSTYALRNSIWQALVTTFFVLVCAFLSAFLCVNVSDYWLKIIEIGSVFLVLWALIGYLGWGIQTFGGNTLPERMNNFWHTCLNLAGSFSLFFLYFLKYFLGK